MIQITILYFGQLRQNAGIARESVSTEAATLAELWEDRSKALGFTFSRKSLRFARNEDLCDPDSRIQNGDTIAFMPPMAGG